MRKLAARIENAQKLMSKEQSEVFSKALGIAIRIECEKYRVAADTLEMFLDSFIKDQEIKAVKGPSS